MNILRKAMVPAASVAAIVLVIAVATPRAVHAVVATLVDVANTPTSAVPTVLAPAASRLYSSSCSGTFGVSATFATCDFETVPAGETLIVETESIFAGVDYGVGLQFAQISNGTTILRMPLVLQSSGANGGSDQYVAALTARIWVKAQQTPQCEVLLTGFNSDSFNNLSCSIFGYLVPAQ